MSLLTDQQILNLILQHEGSAFTNDPKDSGGPTKWGITQAVLSAWKGRSASVQEVRDLSRTEAEAIYRALYLSPFVALADPLRIVVIDMGVNAGVRKATVLLQQMVGATVDGWIGPETIKLSTLNDPELWNSVYVGMRLAFYEDLILAQPKNMKWRNGWRNRALSFLIPLSKKTAVPSASQSFVMAKAA